MIILDILKLRLRHSISNSSPAALRIGAALLIIFGSLALMCLLVFLVWLEDRHPTAFNILIGLAGGGFLLFHLYESVYRLLKLKRLRYRMEDGRE